MTFQQSFRINRPVGATWPADPNDVLKTKKALQRLGLYETPAYGMTDVADDQMFNGIKELQRKWGLEPDGVMKPDRETEKVIDLALTRPELSASAELTAEAEERIQTALLDPTRPEPSREALEARLAEVERQMGEHFRSPPALGKDGTPSEKYLRRGSNLKTEFDYLIQSLDQLKGKETFR